MASTTGQVDLRAENIERDVKGFALQAYKFKQLCMISTSSAWKESYFQETATDLTASGTRAVKGVSRLANFPNADVSWTKKSSFIEKYAIEGVVSMEDSLFNDLDVIARTKLRIGRAIAKAVDDEIWSVISEGQTASTINSLSIAAGFEWDSNTIANRDPVQNILNAVRQIETNNYDLQGSGALLVNATDYANIIGNTKISNNPSFRAADVVANGRVAQLLGLTIIKSESVTADYSLIIKQKEAATWKEAVPMQVHTIEDKGIKWTIRAFELGVTQLINPKAITLIDNTRK